MSRVAILALLLTCRAAMADDPPATSLEITELRAGLDGHFKVGCWTPFEVTLAGGANEARGRVELIVADGDGVPSRVHAPADEPLVLAPGEKKTVSIFAKIGQLKSDVSVVFRHEDGSAVTRRFNTGESPSLAGIMPSEQRLLVTLGSPLAPSDETRFAEQQTQVARLTSVTQLPSEWFGLESADAVIIVTGTEQLSSQFAADSPQLAALETWVRMGGRLVLGVGRNADKLLAPSSPLAKLAPGTLEAVVPLRQSVPLETYAETSESVDADGGEFLVQVPKLKDVAGRIEAYAGGGPRDLPLVVRSPYGFGEVVFVAVDLEQAPLVNWTGRSQFFDRLLRRPRVATSESGEETLGQVTTLGFVDMAGQLRGALDQFTGVRLVQFWLVAVLVVVYIAAIGPLDYYLVTRVFRRPEATWLTFAATVALFGAGAAALAYGLKGRDIRVNQVDLVDYDAASKTVRGTSWANLYSPRNAAYDLSIHPPAAATTAPPCTLFSWMGLPGSGFGGMDATSANLPQFTLPYDFSGGLDRLDKVPIAVWSTRSFVGRWWGEGSGPIEAELADNGKLIGTLRCNLTAPLEDCVLVYDTWAYPLVELRPGQHVNVETQLDPQTVETWLRHVTLEGDRDVAPPYNRESFDLARIVEVMSFYDLAGGERYTRLANDYQAFVDLSELVEDGRAVLVGRRADSATTLECDGRPLEDPQAQRWTYYRFVFPVRSEPRP